MTRYLMIRCAVLCLVACSAERAPDIIEQPIMPQQGTELWGILRLGTQLDGMTFQDFRFAGATLNGAALNNFRIEKGELVAEQNGVTLRNLALRNMHLSGEWQNKDVHPPQNATVDYQITDIVAEDMGYDPTNTGNTYLYTLTQNVDNTGSYQPACPADSDGRRVAIPLDDTWNYSGNRNSAAPWFTLGCTTGAIAKCYRLGYRPWVTAYSNLKLTHQTCTRVIRADYCGDGTFHTMTGTVINLWDNLGSPGPINPQQATPMGMTFEAAWDPNGALCFSHARWAANTGIRAVSCPNRLMPPGQNQPGTVCDNVSQALMNSPAAPRLFNESALNQ